MIKKGYNGVLLLIFLGLVIRTEIENTTKIKQNKHSTAQQTTSDRQNLGENLENW